MTIHNAAYVVHSVPFIPSISFYWHPLLIKESQKLLHRDAKVKTNYVIKTNWLRPKRKMASDQLHHSDFNFLCVFLGIII